MKSTLVVAGVYAGVALAAPSAKAAPAGPGSSWFSWTQPQPQQSSFAPETNWAAQVAQPSAAPQNSWTQQRSRPWSSAPQTNNKPKSTSGINTGFFGGLFGSSSSKPQWASSSRPEWTSSSKPESISSSPSSSGGLFSSWFKGLGSSSSSSGRKGGFGSFGAAAPKPQAPAAAPAPEPASAPAPEPAPAPAPEPAPAPVVDAAPAAEAAQEAPAAPAVQEIPATKEIPGAAEAAEAKPAPEKPAAWEAPIPKPASKPASKPAPKLIPSASASRKHKLWQPKVASPFQIVLSGTVDSSLKLAPEFVEIFDIDLFNTPKSSIQALRKQDKKVICYFSAGSSENWREDFKRFKSSDMGLGVAKDDRGTSYWQGEKWLNLRSQNVRNIMRDRIKLAHEKGCDAVDPDNTDAYSNKNGLGMTEQDSIKFVQFMAEESAKYNMSIGLKNSMEIMPKVQNVVQFAVNEECAAVGECHQYKDFLRAKPVFHIEYTKTKSGGTIIGTDKEYGRGPNSGLGWLFGGRKVTKRDTTAVDASASQACSFKTAPDLGPKFSTVIKVEDLDGWVKFCDGRTVTTRTVGLARSRYSGSSEGSSDSQEDATEKSGNFGGISKLPSFGSGSFGIQGESSKRDVDDGDD